MNQKRAGFSLLHVLLILVIVIALALISAGGWLIYKGQNKTASPSISEAPANNTPPPATPPAASADPAANWKKVDSIGGAYSIKIPDGWELTNYPGNTLHGDGVTFSAGKPAAVATASSPYAGDTRKFNVSFTDKQYDAPQWQPSSEIGTISTTDYSIGSLKGERYFIEYTKTVTGVTEGDRIYQYVFNLQSGKQLDIVYMQNAGDADNLKAVEQAIQTIVVN